MTDGTTLLDNVEAVSRMTISNVVHDPKFAKVTATFHTTDEAKVRNILKKAKAQLIWLAPPGLTGRWIRVAFKPVVEK